MTRGPSQQDLRTSGHYYSAIDGLRTCAILAVIAFHLSDTRVPGGFLGVDLFFAISGFVITLTLLREHERTGRVALLDFYRRRWWRLAPAMVAAILLGLVLTIISRMESVGTWAREALLGLTYTYNIGQAVRHDQGGTILNHLWSLALEEQFYLVWAPVLAVGLGVVVVRRRRLEVLVAAALLLAVGTAATAAGLGNLVAFFVPWTRFDEFACGAAVAIALHGRRSRLRLFSSPWPASIAALVLLGLLGVARIFTQDWLYRGGFLAVAALSAVLVGHTYSGARSPLNAALSWRPVVWLGQRSYGVYLYHLPLILALFHMGAPAWLYGAAGSVGAIALAAASYRWLEQPLRVRGRREVRR